MFYRLCLKNWFNLHKTRSWLCQLACLIRGSLIGKCGNDKTPEIPQASIIVKDFVQPSTQTILHTSSITGLLSEKRPKIGSSTKPILDIVDSRWYTKNQVNSAQRYRAEIRSTLRRKYGLEWDSYTNWVTYTVSAGNCDTRQTKEKILLMLLL